LGNIFKIKLTDEIKNFLFNCDIVSHCFFGIILLKNLFISNLQNNKKKSVSETKGRQIGPAAFRSGLNNLIVRDD
jgi:hypothetical protein